MGSKYSPDPSTHTHSLDGHAVVLWVAAGPHEEGSFWCIVNEHALCRVPVEIGVVPAAGMRGGWGKEVGEACGCGWGSL